MLSLIHDLVITAIPMFLPKSSNHFYVLELSFYTTSSIREKLKRVFRVLIKKINIKKPDWKMVKNCELKF